MKKQILNSTSQNLGIGLTIGNFDGVHLGHQNLINQLIEICNFKRISSAVLTFNPHPVQILRPQSNYLINSYADRGIMLKNLGINEIFEINFDRDFSTLGPVEFFEQHILTIPNLKFVLLGHDFSFGERKSGNSLLLQQLCEQRGIETRIHTPFLVGNEIVSSSGIRKLIDTGDISEVSSRLGRTYFIGGTVVKGDGRGRKIGFPTANISFDHVLKVPARGVYATRVQVGQMIFDSVTNIGFSPTFKTTQNTVVESHLFDFSTDIYGENIKIYFYKKLRDEKKFESVNDLIAQIKLDVVASKGTAR